jgi:CubicO group peptidase (beta-lactamase class C family)
MTRRWGRDPVRTDLVQAVEDAARQALATSTTPGLAVALVYHGQVVWAAGYGVADRTTGQPVTAATRFQAASLSKPVTAWGAGEPVPAEETDENDWFRAEGDPRR